MEKYEKPTMEIQIFNTIKTLVEISGSDGIDPQSGDF